MSRRKNSLGYLLNDSTTSTWVTSTYDLTRAANLSCHQASPVSLCFFQFIYQCFANRNMDQKQFAEKLGVTQPMINKYEKGETIPPAQILLKIAKLGKTTVERILEGG